MVRVVEVAADADSTAADLATLISKDPTLTTEVLRAVNSAYYGLRRKIETVNHGVTFMGMSAVRNLVLCLGVRQLVRPTDCGDFPFELFWECSVRRAAAAACLARRLGHERSDEYFTIGLCLDIGILASIRDDPTFGAEYARLMVERAGRRHDAERKRVEPHDLLGARLLKSWKLPDELVETVRYHHTPERAPTGARVRCAIARAAEAIADLLQVKDKAEALDQAQRELVELQLEPELLRSIIEEVVEDVSDAADMLNLTVGVQPSYEEIVRTASDALLDLSLAEPSADRDDGIAEQQRRAIDLAQRNEELERQAATDPLTGLANRRLLDDVLTRDLAQARRQGAAVSLLMIDVDRFKQLNDGYGHQAGDRVLRRVASVIRQLIRRADVCARYGGEEFAVVLPFTDEVGARIVAERMREAVQRLAVQWEDEELSVTVSIGGVTLHAADGADSATNAIRLADRALYRAKQEGRNRTCWHTPSID